MRDRMLYRIVVVVVVVVIVVMATTIYLDVMLYADTVFRDFTRVKRIGSRSGCGSQETRSIIYLIPVYRGNVAS